MQKKTKKKSIQDEIDRKKNSIQSEPRHNIILVTQFKINEILPTDPSMMYKTCNIIFDG